MGSPGDDIDRRLMQGEVVDALPLAVRGALLLPDEDLAIVSGRREDVAVLGMRPRDAPDSAVVATDTDVSNAIAFQKQLLHRLTP